MKLLGFLGGYGEEGRIRLLLYGFNGRPNLIVYGHLWFLNPRESCFGCIVSKPSTTFIIRTIPLTFT